MYFDIRLSFFLFCPQRNQKDAQRRMATDAAAGRRTADTEHRQQETQRSLLAAPLVQSQRLCL